MEKNSTDSNIKNIDFIFISTQFLMKGGYQVLDAFKKLQKSGFYDAKLLIVTRLEEVRNIWKGPIVLKGLMDNRDALKAKDYVDAIYLSNHGGRQLDIAPSPLQVLPNIRKDLGNDFPILIDSGFYSGQDVVKGLMLGADFVMIGRPFMIGLAALGAKAMAGNNASPSLEIALPISADSGIKPLR